MRVICLRQLEPRQLMPVDPFEMINRFALDLPRFPYQPSVLISSHPRHMEIPMSSSPPVSNAPTSSYSPDDDLTGVTSPALRRRIQNRLNQRAYRKIFTHL